MARAGVRRFSTLATTAVIVAGVIPAIDFAGVLGGPRSYLTLHRTFTHSILGGSALAVLVAWMLWHIGRKWEPEPARFSGLLAAAACGVAGHLLLDLGDNYGEKLLWPFSQKWYAWNLWPQLDPWLLLLLARTRGVPWLLAVVGAGVPGLGRIAQHWRTMMKPSRSAVLGFRSSVIGNREPMTDNR